jgi:hypothetical protein
MFRLFSGYKSSKSLRCRLFYHIFHIKQPARQQQQRLTGAGGKKAVRCPIEFLHGYRVYNQHIGI